MAVVAFWLLFLSFVGVFAAQVARRVQLIAAAPNTFSVDNLGVRVSRFLVDVIFQARTIKERPVAGIAHAFVFWGFVAFGGYTLTEFLRGLGIVDLTHTGWFEGYRLALAPFAAAVLGGILYLLIRRAFVRSLIELGRALVPRRYSPNGAAIICKANWSAPARPSGLSCRRPQRMDRFSSRPCR